MVLYGRNPVREALRGPRAVQRIWATPRASGEPWLRRAGARVEVVPGEDIERHCGSTDHQGVCAEVSRFVYADPDRMLTGRGVIVALDQVQDPQNLGSICRSAECAGVAGLVIPERRAAPITAAVAKASAGAIEHLPIAQVRNLADFLSEAKRAGWWCYGADPQARSGYNTVDYGERAVLVLGSEGRGVRPRVASACDLLVAIPVRGRIESLNVSAAATLLMYVATGT